MNKKIGVIGLGFVGDALKNGFEHFGITDISFYDPKIQESSMDDIINADIVFVCVPTPMKTGGSIDDSIVDKVLLDLNDRKYGGIAVIKSTLLPTSVRIFTKKYSNLRIATNPEFLTERRARQDFIDTEWVIIGGDQESCRQIRDLYEFVYRDASQHIEYAEVTAEIAMMAKYMTNTWFSVKVSLMNEYNQIWNCLRDSDRVLGDWDDLISAFSLDKRVGPTHLQVPGPDGDRGFGGKCFPKDLNALMSLCTRTGTNCDVMKSAWNDNLIYRKDKDWLNIDGAVVEDYVEE